MSPTRVIAKRVRGLQGCLLPAERAKRKQALRLVIEVNDRDVILGSQACIVDERLGRLNRLVKLCGSERLTACPDPSPLA